MSVTARIADLRKQGQEIKTKMDEVFAEGTKSVDGGTVTDAKAAEKFRELLDQSKDIVTEIKQLGGYEELDSLTAEPAAQPTLTLPGGSGGSLWTPPGAAEVKSIGQAFIDSDIFKNRVGGKTEEFEVKDSIMRSELEMLERKDIYTGIGGTLTRFGFGTATREPMVQRPYRTDRVRDLFPVANTTSNLIEYLRVLGYLGGANNAAVVGERDEAGTAFALKPQTELQFEPAQAPIRTIAHWEAAHRNTLDDEPQLRSIIDTELLYGLRLAEDDELLNGDGTGEHLMGILRTPGVQVYPGGVSPSPVQAGDTRIDAIRRAITRVQLALYEPTGVVLHPLDWERIETTKDANLNYIIAASVAVGGEKRVWRLPVVATPAMQEGTALVGAFGLGAKVYDRQRSNIRVAEQHADFFLRNAVVILAEERLGLTVARPESFVKINLEDGVAPAA